MSDSVVLVMEVEEAFGISLEDEACERVATVGDLCELVLAAVPRTEQERCLTALAFWRVRHALVGVFGVGRATVRPETGLAALLWSRETALWERRAAWTRLEQRLGLRLPPLERPSWLVRTSVGACACVLLGGLGLSASGFVSGGSALTLALVLAAATSPWQAYLPPGIVTVGDLARSLVLSAPGRLAAPGGGFTRAQIEELVPRIIALQLGLPLEKVALDARIVADLEID